MRSELLEIIQPRMAEILGMIHEQIDKKGYLNILGGGVVITGGGSLLSGTAELATEINGNMPRHVADRVADLLNEGRIAVNGSKLLILGVAYKGDVSDIRESPALDVIRLLESKGAEIRYHDPHIGEFVMDGTTYKSTDLSDQVLESADVTVIITAHSEIDYERVVARTPRVFDTRNATRDVTGGRERIRKL